MSVSTLHTPRRSRRWAFAVTTLLLMLAGIVVLVAGGAWVLRAGPATGASAATDRFTVRRGDFDITVPSSGELAAMRSIEIVSELESRAVITSIVDEGVRVQKGDVLITLDDKSTRDARDDAADSLNLAQASVTAAIADLEIRKTANEAELEQANVDIELAELELSAWREGDHVSDLQEYELEVLTSEKEYVKAKERYETSLSLREEEFISREELQDDEIKMLRAESAHKQAQLSLQVYNDIMIEKSRKELESDVAQAKAKKLELKQRHQNEIQSLEAELESKKFQLESRQRRLAELETQLENCTIYAPQDGLVVYATSLDSGGHRGRSDQNPPEVGSEIPRNRPVIVLPDVSEMAAEVKVNEALSGKIEAGQPVLLESDALPDVVLRGEVVNVSVLAETGGWRDPNRRDYRVKIRLLDGEEYGLKPAMRCKAEIQVGRTIDVLHVPVAAVFYEGDQAIAYVPSGSGYAQRPIQVGARSELYIEVLGGLVAGDQVLLRQPAPEEVVSRVETKRRGAGASGDAEASGDEFAPMGESDAGASAGHSTEAGMPASGQPGGGRRGPGQPGAHGGGSGG